MLTCSVQVYKLPNVSRKTPTQITVTPTLFLSNTLDKDLVENNIIFELFTNDNSFASKVVFFKMFLFGTAGFKEYIYSVVFFMSLFMFR